VPYLPSILYIIFAVIILSTPDYQHPVHPLLLITPGVYILESNPPPPRGTSANDFWGKKYEKGKITRGESVKEKGRKGKENEKR
jgi:hypothetical protein